MPTNTFQNSLPPFFILQYRIFIVGVIYIYTTGVSFSLYSTCGSARLVELVKTSPFQGRRTRVQFSPRAPYCRVVELVNTLASQARDLRVRVSSRQPIKKIKVIKLVSFIVVVYIKTSSRTLDK